MENNLIVYNAIQTPDGTILESRHRHDYQTHHDANGFMYMVDGGLSYLRRGASQGAPLAKELSLTVDDDFETIRTVMTWGTRGRDGQSELQWVAIKDMTTDHIEACLDTQLSMAEQFRLMFEKELKFRVTHEAAV